MKTNIPNKIAIITGAGSGIGRAIAISLYSDYHLILVGRNITKLKAVALDIEKRGGSTSYRKVDITKDISISDFVYFFRKEYDHLDVLIHSAGIIRLGEIEKSPITDFDLQYQTNLRAPYLLTQKFLSYLKKSRGQIVFINSSAIGHIKPNTASYTATKAGLKVIADTLRLEVKKDGIRVISIFPGRTDTPMQKFIFQKENRQYDKSKLLTPNTIASHVKRFLSYPKTKEVPDRFIRSHKIKI